MTPDQLKASILQLAIQGKLVPQRPEDGTAEELYQQIQREKKKLTASGKLKKEKPLPPISEDEIPFDIPDSWKWVRLGDVAKLGSGLTPSKQNPEFYVGGTIPWLLTGDLNDGYIETIPNKITEKALSTTTIKIKPANSVVVAMYGATIGKLGILKAPSCMNQACCCIEEYKGVYHLYIFYYLWANRQKLRSSGEGGAQPNISKEKLVVQMLPLPPLAEQQRIVERIEQMLPLVEQYGEAYTALESLDARFPDDMRKSILKYAIQGKLVPQRPEDGIAEELYQQIQKEKKKLIAAGKLKKEKPLPPITEDEIPFDIPDSWKWVHMGDIFAHNTGKAQNSTAETRNGILRKFITTSNVYWNRFDFSKVKEMLFTENEIEKCTVQKGDLLVCEGGDCGRAAIWQDDESMCIQNHIHRLRPYVGVEIMFFYYVFWLLKQTGYLNGKGVGIKGLSSNTLHKLPCPLPTLAEQRRIVKNLNRMLIEANNKT